MASLGPEEKVKFLLQVMAASEGGKTDLQQVAAVRGDKKANIAYQYKALVASTGEFVLEGGSKVVPIDGDTPAVKKPVTPKTPKTPKTPRIKKAKKAEAETDADVDAEVEGSEEGVPAVPPSPSSGTKRARAKKEVDGPIKKRQTKKQKQDAVDDDMDDTVTVKEDVDVGE